MSRTSVECILDGPHSCNFIHHPHAVIIITFCYVKLELNLSTQIIGFAFCFDELVVLPFIGQQIHSTCMDVHVYDN